MDGVLTTFVDVRLEAVERHLWQPGQGLRGSTRTAYALWLVLEGSLEVSVAGRRRQVPAGAVFLLPPKRPMTLSPPAK